MSVHGPQSAVVQCLLQAKSRSTQSRAYHKIFLVPPTLPGRSIFYINFDHWSLIKRPVCIVLVLNTCGPGKNSQRGRSAVKSCSSSRTTSRRTTFCRTVTTSRPGIVKWILVEVLLVETAVQTTVSKK